MSYQLAKHAYYFFLDRYSGYNHIIIALEDQEKTTLNCPYDMLAFRRMSFGICNAPGTFQRCMMAIFSNMVEKFIKVCVVDFLVVGASFDECLENFKVGHEEV